MISIHCDICDFKSENEKPMITYISDENKDCYPCAKYFGTKQCLIHHNEVNHKEFLNLTESEGEDTVPTKSNE